MNEISIATLLDTLLSAQKTYHAALAIVQHYAPELFKEVRQQRNLTQRQFAAILQVDFSFISKIENGHMRPGKPVLARLAAYLAEYQTIEGGEV